MFGKSYIKDTVQDTEVTHKLKYVKGSNIFSPGDAVLTVKKKKN